MRAEDEKTLASLILALGVIVALFFPQISRAFEPYLLPSLFFVMVFSLFPFARLEAGELTRLHPVVLPLVFWQQFILPALVIMVAQLFDLERQLLYFILVTVTSGSLFASPTLVQLMGLNQKVAVQTVIVSTVAAPISIYLFFGLLQGGELALDLSLFGFRMLVFLVIPIAIFAFLRSRISGWSDGGKDKVDTVGRWGSVLALVAFCFALEAQVTESISNNPQQIIAYLAIAVAVAAGIGFSTRLVLARYGTKASATAMVLASFRNVGLTFGLVGHIAGSELAIYVGVCQIPMFFSPLLFDLFVGKSRVPLREGTMKPDTQSYENDVPADPVPVSAGGVPSGVGRISPAANQAGHFTGTGDGGSRQYYGVLPAGNAATATALDLDSYAVPEHTTAEPVEVDENLEDYLTDGLEVSRDDARALLNRLRVHYTQVGPSAAVAASRLKATSTRYIALFLVLCVAGITAVWQANRYFSPMLFDQELISEVAQAHIEGKNFGVFDLNINIRDLRNETIERMANTPEVVVLGASHWQEAHVELLEGRDFYNSHVHRDYYEDMLAVTEMWTANGKLPKEMIITIRDNLLTPIKDRTDFLWLPGIKYYREFANRIGLEPHSVWETLPVNTWRELLSMPLLVSQATTMLTAPVKPHATQQRDFTTLDTLLPGGSILWSEEHKRLFTQERARSEAMAFAEARRNDPPKIDPKGVAHMEALFDFLTEKGVKVTLAHPQFNPIFWSGVEGTPYMDGLKKIEDLTQHWAEQYGFDFIGGFAPESVGCTSDMYIDAEHGNPTCLGMLLSQYGAGKTGTEVKPTFDFVLRGALKG